MVSLLTKSSNCTDNITQLSMGFFKEIVNLLNVHAEVEQPEIETAELTFESQVVDSTPKPTVADVATQCNFDVLRQSTMLRPWTSSRTILTHTADTEYFSPTTLLML